MSQNKTQPNQSQTTHNKRNETMNVSNKTQTNQSQPFHNKRNETMNQSEFETNKCKWSQARENAGE